MSANNNSNIGNNPSANMRMPFTRGPMNRGKEVVKAKDIKGTLLRLGAYFRAEYRLIIVILITVCISVAASVYAPKLISNAIDCITAGEPALLTGILLTMLIIYILGALSGFVQSRLSAVLSQRVVVRLRQELFDRIVKLPISYIDTHPHGDIMSRMTNDIENISSTISTSLSSMFAGVMTIIATVAMMVYLCPILALLSCTTVILTIITTKYLSVVMRNFFRKRQMLLGRLNSTVEEMVTGARTVAAYNRQDIICNEFNEISDELTRVGIVAEIFGGSMGPIMNVINNIGFVIIAAFGGYFAINGVISIGIISAFIVYAKQFGRPIDELAQIYAQIQTAIAGAERVFSVLDQEIENQGGELIIDTDTASGEIVFENVNFSYEKGKQVLYDFNLTVKPGQKVALVGATGSGKTTVVNLLMRFYDYDSGSIKIDGVDIKSLSLDSLRRNTAIVLQDTVLFADTIYNNLKYSNSEATLEDVKAAVKMSNCDTMINKLSKGFDTMLERGGHNISHGQRQLMSIARAFLVKPKILILDEATSSVDTRTEKNIQDASAKLMSNRTSLIIAHRLSTIKDADCIVVMDKGRIVETGTHDELLDKRNVYYKLYMTQFAGMET